MTTHDTLPHTSDQVFRKLVALVEEYLDSREEDLINPVDSSEISNLLEFLQERGFGGAVSNIYYTHNI